MSCARAKFRLRPSLSFHLAVRPGSFLKTGSLFVQESPPPSSEVLPPLPPQLLAWKWVSYFSVTPSVAHPNVLFFFPFPRPVFSDNPRPTCSHHLSRLPGLIKRSFPTLDQVTGPARPLKDPRSLSTKTQSSPPDLHRRFVIVSMSLSGGEIVAALPTRGPLTLDATELVRDWTIESEPP